jgi:hypothetical protein
MFTCTLLLTQRDVNLNLHTVINGDVSINHESFVVILSVPGEDMEAGFDLS